MSDMRPLYCEVHGQMARVGPQTSPFGTFTMFCPVATCHRELFPDDPLTEIERQGKPSPTFEEWKARDDMPVLDMGTVRLPEDES